MGFEMKQRERERPRNQKNEKEDRDRGRKWNCFGSLLADFILAADWPSWASQGDHRPVGMALPQSVRKFVVCLASVFVPWEDGIWGQEPR